MARGREHTEGCSLQPRRHRGNLRGGLGCRTLCNPKPPKEAWRGGKRGREGTARTYPA